VEASWAYPRGVFFTKLEIAGDDGLLEFDSRESTPLQVQFSHAEGRSDGLTIPESPLAAEDDPYFQEDKHFLECVEDGKPFAIQPEEAMQAVRVALAAIESVRTNQPVDIDAYEEVA
jgi:predicted dehydrogenase